MGNLEATSVISAWRDYEHASRTNSMYSPRQVSPIGTARIASPNSRITSTSHEVVMLSPSPDRLMQSTTPVGFSSTIKPSSGSPAEKQAGGTSSHSPVSVSTAAEKQSQIAAGPALTNRHSMLDRTAQPHQQQTEVQLVGRPPRSPVQQQQSTSSTSPVSPFSQHASTPFDSKQSKHKQRHTGAAVSPTAVVADVHQRADNSNGASGPSAVGDTVVTVQDADCAKKPRIAGIDEVRQKSLVVQASHRLFELRVGMLAARLFRG